MTLRTARWLIGAICLLGLAWHGANGSFPPPPVPLDLTLSLPAGTAGQTSALVTTGRPGAGTLLYIRYVGPTTVVFGYDSWAVGGPESEPVAISPGVPSPLRVALPALTAPPRVDRSARGELQVFFGAREVLRGSVHYHGRQPDELYFAQNPIGGTITNSEFPGVLRTAAGAALVGHPAALYPFRARLWHWLTAAPLAPLLALATAMSAAWLVPLAGSRLGARWRHVATPEFPGHSRPTHLTFVATAAVCTAASVAVVTGFSFRLFATESFGQFYDYQIAGLLAGRLDVPAEALGAEAFLFEGKTYGYFGPTPALLRLPFALAGVAFGQLSRLYLVIFFLLCLGAIYALLVHAARRLSGRRTWPARWHVVLLLGGTGLGSTLFFLGSRAYIYHEAILCGVAFALWGAWCCLRWLAAPAQHRWWIAALTCGVLAVQARPPAGLFALACLGFSALALLLRAGRTPAGRTWAAVRTPLCAGALSVLGVLSFNGLSYLKFRSFDGAPLRYHVQYHAERVARLAGSNFHAGNLAYGFAAYGWRPNFELRPTFPYVFALAIDPREFPGSRIDLAEDTLPLPYAMPALVLLAAFGAGIAVTRWPAARLPLAVLAAGTAPMALALCAAVAVSHRYTADFVPFLAAAAAFGTAGLDLLPRAPRRWLGAVVITLAVLTVPVTLALTLHYQGEVVWGVPDEVKARYLSLRQTMDHFFGFSRP